MRFKKKTKYAQIFLKKGQQTFVPYMQPPKTAASNSTYTKRTKKG
jgi:hypothetical protein